MKRTLKNLVIMGLAVMMLGTTCYAQEVTPATETVVEGPQVYIDGLTFEQTVEFMRTCEEARKETIKARTDYEYTIETIDNNTIIIHGILYSKQYEGYSTYTQTYVYDYTKKERTEHSVLQTGDLVTELNFWKPITVQYK